MTKIRLTEQDLHKIIKSAAEKIIKEYIGDTEEYGRYDIDTDEDYYNMPDDEYNDLQQQLANKYEMEDEDMKQMADEWEAEQYIGQDYFDPGDGDLYRGAY